MMQAHALPAVGRAAQHPAARLRRARAAAGRRDAGEDRRARPSRGSTIRRACESLRRRFEACTARCGATPRALATDAIEAVLDADADARRDLLRAAKLRGIVDVAGLMAGVDEVGRGPLAGPVVAAAVILDEQADDPRPERLEAARRRGARAARSTRSAQARCAAASPRRASTEIDTAQHPARGAAGDAARGRGAARSSRSIVLVDGNQRPSWRCRCAPSSAATPRCARSRPRRSSPRCTATGSACSCTRSIRSTASTATRATRRPST